jgi:hypothetical protein
MVDLVCCQIWEDCAPGIFGKEFFTFFGVFPKFCCPVRSGNFNLLLFVDNFKLMVTSEAIIAFQIKTAIWTPHFFSSDLIFKNYLGGIGLVDF